MRYSSTALHPVDEDAEIVDAFLTIQARTAAEQNRSLARASHAKGVWVGASFEVLEPAQGHDLALAARLAQGLCAMPDTYSATVRCCNSSPSVNSDWEPDVRGLSFNVELRRSFRTTTGTSVARQDFSLSSAPTLPFNDIQSYMVHAGITGASNEAIALGSMPFCDQQIFAQTQRRLRRQKRQAVRPYQQIRYWSTVPYRHGAQDVVKYAIFPAETNPAGDLDRRNSNALGDELIRHVNHDATMSVFDFSLQFLDVETMTYRGKHRDAAFWIENAAVEWPEAQAAFHRVARLTLRPHSQLSAEAAAAGYIDVHANSLADHAPIGEINRARGYALAASRKTRMAVS